MRGRLSDTSNSLHIHVASKFSHPHRWLRAAGPLVMTDENAWCAAGTLPKFFRAIWSPGSVDGSKSRYTCHLPFRDDEWVDGRRVGTMQLLSRACVPPQPTVPCRVGADPTFQRQGQVLKAVSGQSGAEEQTCSRPVAEADDGNKSLMLAFCEGQMRGREGPSGAALWRPLSVRPHSTHLPHSNTP